MTTQGVKDKRKRWHYPQEPFKLLKTSRCIELPQTHCFSYTKKKQVSMRIDLQYVKRRPQDVKRNPLNNRTGCQTLMPVKFLNTNLRQRRATRPPFLWLYFEYSACLWAHAHASVRLSMYVYLCQTYVSLSVWNASRALSLFFSLSISLCTYSLGIHCTNRPSGSFITPSDEAAASCANKRKINGKCVNNTSIQRARVRANVYV